MVSAGDDLSDLAQAAVDAGAHYDALPYVSHPFPQMQPARLAGLARMFGLSAPEVSHARVLEIGCASGGHLIPLAARFPHSLFLGLDPSRVQINEGRSRALSMRLSNIELRDVGVEGLKPEDGTFDYILCHGVYSWVPDEVRSAILSTIERHLAPDGIAYVSYNVLPGWRLLQGLRDALISVTSLESNPRQKLIRARMLLDLMKRGTDADSIWGKLWRQEAHRLSEASDDYLGHEFLETHNAPCTFPTFMAAAEAFNLSYLGEAELFTMLPENGNSEIAAELRGFVDNKLLAVEHMLDLVNGRTFRQTLLVHAANAAHINRALVPEAMEGLHLIAPLDLAETHPDDPKLRCWADGVGRSITTPDPNAALAIERLIARLPASSTLDDLTYDMEGADREMAADAIFRMLTVGLVDVSTEPVEALASLSLKPKLFEVARRDAQRGSASTANLRHEITYLSAPERLILPLVDGSRSLGIIANAIEKTHLVRSMGVSAPDLVLETLEEIARRGLLVG